MLLLVLLVGLVGLAGATNEVDFPLDTDTNGNGLVKASSRQLGNNNDKDNKKACPHKKENEVWYKLAVTIFTAQPLDCTDKDWVVIKKFLEKEIRKIRLFDDYSISNLRVKLCFNNDARRRRHLQSDHDSDLDMAEDPLGLRTGTIHNRTVAVQEERRLGDNEHPNVLSVQFNLHFSGGGRCYFCREDKSDSNSRKRSLLDRTDSDDAANNNNNNNTTYSELRDLATDLSLDIDGNPNLSVSLATELKQIMVKNGIGSQGQVPNDVSDTVDNDWDVSDTEFDKEPTQTTTTIPTDLSTTTTTTTTTTNSVPTPSASFLRGGHNQQRQLGPRCGGCWKLSFSKDGKNHKTKHSKLLKQREYYQSYGVEIKAFPGKGCRLPSQRGRLIQSNHPQKAPNLGSPNQKCSKKGPGSGDGGAPKLPNGKANPGANCVGGNFYVLSIDQDSEKDFQPCKTGGTIAINFAHPVKLNEVGLMDVQNKSSVKMEVQFKSGSKRFYYPTGFGVNSVEAVHFNGLYDVVGLKIRFNRLGGVTYLDYCHDCSKGIVVGNMKIPNKPPQSEDEYKELVASLTVAGMTSDLEGAISTGLDYAIHDRFRKRDNHCLNRKSISISAKMKVVTRKEARNCDR